jgi:hypothetical protein
LLILGKKLAGIQKGNVHAINYLKTLSSLPIKKQLLGDKAYRSKLLQMDLLDKYHVKIRVPLRINHINDKKLAQIKHALSF